jgi:DnaK suppressor protein
MTALNVDFKHRLSQQLTDLKTENESVKLFLDGADKSLPDMMDRAHNESAEAAYLQRYSRNLKKIEALENALNMLDTGSFGICRICGEQIGLRRQMAIPDAVHCIQCQSDLDR